MDFVPPWNCAGEQALQPDQLDRIAEEKQDKGNPVGGSGQQESAHAHFMVGVARSSRQDIYG